ncbi:Nucleotide-binding alpha-beta plait [Gracilaria domingensis]|nr:Nucleotide-binding alpha-beta plait [Gracilaria domingensis]
MEFESSRAQRNKKASLYTDERRALFIKAVPVSLFSAAALTEHFQQLPVTVSNVSLRGTKKETSRRTAVVTFTSVSDAALALAKGRSHEKKVLNLQIYEPYEVRQKARLREKKEEEDWLVERSPTLIISPVPNGVRTARQLKEVLYHFGKGVLDVQLTRRTGADGSQRTALVKMWDKPSAEALLCSNPSYGNKRLRIGYLDDVDVAGDPERARGKVTQGNASLIEARSNPEPNLHPMEVVKFQTSPTAIQCRIPTQKQPPWLETRMDTSRTEQESEKDQLCQALCVGGDLEAKAKTTCHGVFPDVQRSSQAFQITQAAFHHPKYAETRESAFQQELGLECGDMDAYMETESHMADENVAPHESPLEFFENRLSTPGLCENTAHKIAVQSTPATYSGSLVQNLEHNKHQSTLSKTQAFADNTDPGVIDSNTQSTTEKPIEHCELKNLDKPEAVFVNIDPIPAKASAQSTTEQPIEHSGHKNPDKSGTVVVITGSNPTDANSQRITELPDIERSLPANLASKVVGVRVGGDGEDQAKLRTVTSPAKAAQSREKIVAIATYEEKDHNGDRQNSSLPKRTETIAGSVKNAFTHRCWNEKAIDKSGGPSANTEFGLTSTNARWNGGSSTGKENPGNIRAVMSKWRAKGLRKEIDKHALTKLRNEGLKVAVELANKYAKARKARNDRYKDLRNKLLAQHMKHVTEIEDIIGSASGLLRSLQEDGLSRSEISRVSYTACDHLERSAAKIKCAEQFIKRAELWPWEGLLFPRLPSPTLWHLREKGRNVWEEIHNFLRVTFLKPDELVKDEKGMKGPVEAVPTVSLLRLRNNDSVSIPGVKPCIGLRGDERNHGEGYSNPRKRQRDNAICEEKSSQPKRRRS